MPDWEEALRNLTRCTPITNTGAAPRRTRYLAGRPATPDHGLARDRRTCPRPRSKSVSKNNYGYEKRQKELKRQRKREEKEQRKLDRKNARSADPDQAEQPASEPPVED